MSRWAPIAFLVAVAVLLSLVVWPGHMDADALQQMSQAKTGHFNDWYAPILDWLWGQLFRLGGSPGIVLLCSVVIILLSIHQLLRVCLSRWVAAIVACAIAIFPPVFGFLGSLQRDVWFAAFTLAAYASLLRGWSKPARARYGWMAVSLAAVWLSMASRQNGFAAVIPAVILVWYRLLDLRRTGSSGVPEEPRPVASLPSPDSPPLASGANGHDTVRPGARPALRHRVARSLAVVLLSLVTFLSFYETQHLLTYDAIGAVHSSPQQEIYEEDLAGMSLRLHTMLLPRSVFAAQQSLAVLRRFYSPYTVIPLLSGPNHPLVTYADSAMEHQLQTAWVHNVLNHPGTYFRVRWQLWTMEIGWSGPSFEPYHPGIDANPWGYRPTFPTLERFDLAYLRTFSLPGLLGGPLFRPWAYLVVSLVLGLSLARRKRAAPVRIIGWMALGTVLYTLTYSLLADANAFRWNWLLVIVTMIAIVVWLTEWLNRLVDKRVASRWLSELEPVNDPQARRPQAKAFGAMPSSRSSRSSQTEPLSYGSP
jgi:hypothetical protein